MQSIQKLLTRYFIFVNLSSTSGASLIPTTSLNLATELWWKWRWCHRSNKVGLNRKNTFYHFGFFLTKIEQNFRFSSSFSHQFEAFTLARRLVAAMLDPAGLAWYLAWACFSERWKGLPAPAPFPNRYVTLTAHQPHWIPHLSSEILSPLFHWHFSTYFIHPLVQPPASVSRGENSFCLSSHQQIFCGVSTAWRLKGTVSIALPPKKLPDEEYTVQWAVFEQGCETALDSLLKQHY